MKTDSQGTLVLVTAPDLKTARVIAQAALEARLAACANLIPAVESHYWWHGKLDSSAEVLIVFKTATARLARLEELVLARHPYDTPEFVAVRLDSGNARYLEWLGASVRGPRREQGKNRAKP